MNKKTEYAITEDLKSYEILKLAEVYAQKPISEWPALIEVPRATKILLIKSYDLEGCFKKHRLLEKKDVKAQ